MAAQVLGGSGNVSYTNSTGQNVRLVINYLKTGEGTCTITFQGASLTISRGSYGKTLAYRDSHGGSTGAWTSAMSVGSGYQNTAAVPLEIALSNGETFSITSSPSSAIEGYNIIIIPEAG